jgi:hypothetical protein
MSQSIHCSRCGAAAPVEAISDGTCPNCGESFEPVKAGGRTWTIGRIVKLCVAILLGVTPGAVLIAFVSPGDSSYVVLGAIVMVLGVFVAVAFALRKVDAGNVAALTVAVTVARNAPRSMQEGIIESIAGRPENGHGDEQEGSGPRK